MKPILLNLDQQQAKHVAKLHEGDEWVIVKPLIRQLRDSIRHEFTVIGNKVCRVQDVTEGESSKTGIAKMHIDDLGQTWETHKRGLQSWFNSRYGKGAWEKNPYVEVVMLRKVC